MTIGHLAASVKAADDAGNGTFEAIASTANLDRDGEMIAARAFNPLPATVPIHVDHQMNSEGLVATGRPFYDGDVLKVTGRFAGTPKAQMIRELVVEGHLSTMSVGFMGATYDRESGKAPLITRAELLEVSFVTIPSNRQALVTSARQYGGSSSEVRGVQIRALLALADLALDDVRRIDKQQTSRVLRDAEALLARPPTPHEVLRDAQALLAQLKGPAR